jgi:hypothetical protein
MSTTKLPEHLKLMFFRLIRGETTIQDFEKWLYSENELETLLSKNDYYRLISIDFRKNSSKHEVIKVINDYINIGEYETYDLVELLEEAQQKTEKLPEILLKFYDLYCGGYYFLQTLGIVYGLSFDTHFLDGNSYVSWLELSKVQQRNIIDGLSSELDEELETVKGWLMDKKIVLTGQKIDGSCKEFLDFREV